MYTLLSVSLARVAGAEFELRPSGQLVPLDPDELPAIATLSELELELEAA